MSTCIVVTNTLSATPRRSATVERRKLSLATLARRRGLNPRRQAVICQRNGRWISQTQWRRVCAKNDDVVIFILLPRNSTVWRSIAALAVVVLATAIAGPGGGAAALAAFSGVSVGVATALIVGTAVIAGSYLINALIPIQSPTDVGLNASIASADGASPTYAFSVSSQQNVARLGGSIPALYGRGRFVPDLAATAWTEWADGLQTLHQTMVLTQGEIDVEGVFLGRTPISTFEEITTQIVPPNGTVTLFESEVYQAPDVRGVVLSPPNDLSTKFVDDGTFGPFAATPPGITTARIGVDIGFPRGLYYSENDGSLTHKTVAWKVEAQQIDDAGAAIGGWSLVANETFDSQPGSANTSSTGTFMGGGYDTTNKMASPLTLSYRYTMASVARWQLRVTRTDTKDLTNRAGHDISWNGLRGFLGGGNYGNLTVLAMAITATPSINDTTIRQISVLGTRKLRQWDGFNWTAPVATRSISWAIADMLTNETYGGGRTVADFDLEQLLALDAVWAARGDTFDFYVSKAGSLWSSIQTAGLAGRTRPYHQAGIVRFYRDAPQTIPVQSFSAENIVKDTFALKFILPSPEDESDGIEFKYFDERVYNYASIRKRRDGLPGDPSNPSPVTLDGVVQATQAANEADYRLAADKYQRVLISFDTEMEGMIPSYGDLILVSHQTPRWGQSSRLFDWTPATKTLTLWGRLDFGDFTKTYFVRFRDAAGRPSAAVQVEQVVDEATLRLSALPTYTDGSAFDLVNLPKGEPMHVLVGTGEDFTRLALFRGAKPRGGTKKVSISAVLYDARVYVN